MTNLRSYTDFIPFFNKEIYFEDNRSATMPRRSKGLIIGIRLDSVEIRVNNNMTQWYPINHNSIIYEL